MTSGPSERRMVVRPPRTEAEIAAFFQQAVRIFSQRSDTEQTARRRRMFDETAPGFDPTQWRAAFDGDQLVGGYTFYRRALRIGSARIVTGCIGNVGTDPEHRGHGIARLLMDDSVRYAREQGCAMLMLDGIPDFYHRWGYVDVLDTGWCRIQVADIPTDSPESLRTRPATVADAPPLLDLYQRHHRHYAGFFERTLDDQMHLIRHSADDRAITVASDDSGTIWGYSVPSERNPIDATETAADSWPAVLALLQAGAASTPTLRDPDATLRWRIPLDSATYYHLSDHLSVRYEMRQQPDADWMVSPLDIQALFALMVPEWRARWAACRHDWEGTLRLVVGEDAISLQLSAEGSLTVDPAGAPSATASLSPPAFAQMIFGYRPVAHLCSQPGQQIPDDLRPVLNILFPPIRGWVAGTDSF